MKKLSLFWLLLVSIFSVSACNTKNTEIDALNIFFVPSRDSNLILEQTKPLVNLLKAELTLLGFEFEEISIFVGSSYEAVGEALEAGTAHVGYMPGSTFALYSKSGNIDAILTLSRKAQSKDFTNPVDWNDGLPTTLDENTLVTYYRGIIVAGPSPVGRVLANKVNSGEQLTWEDLNSATWCIQGPTSPSGTLYPSLLLYERYNKKITDLEKVVNTRQFGSSVAFLATETCDVSNLWADARRDWQDEWLEEYNRKNSIWEETDVIFVTDSIFNEMLAVSKLIVSDELKEALAQAFINIINTPEGKEIFSIFYQDGFQRSTNLDYENEIKILEILSE